MLSAELFEKQTSHNTKLMLNTHPSWQCTRERKMLSLSYEVGTKCFFIIIDFLLLIGS